MWTLYISFKMLIPRYFTFYRYCKFFFCRFFFKRVQQNNLAEEEMSLWHTPGRTPHPCADAAGARGPEGQLPSVGHTRTGVPSGVGISKTKRLGCYNQRPNNTGEGRGENKEVSFSLLWLSEMSIPAGWAALVCEVHRGPLFLPGYCSATPGHCCLHGHSWTACTAMLSAVQRPTRVAEGHPQASGPALGWTQVLWFHWKELDHSAAPTCSGVGT